MVGSYLTYTQLQETQHQALRSLQEKQHQVMQAIAALQTADRAVLTERTSGPTPTPLLVHVKLRWGQRTTWKCSLNCFKEGWPLHATVEKWAELNARMPLGMGGTEAGEKRLCKLSFKGSSLTLSAQAGTLVLHSQGHCRAGGTGAVWPHL